MATNTSIGNISAEEMKIWISIQGTFTYILKWNHIPTVGFILAEFSTWLKPLNFEEIQMAIKNSEKKLHFEWELLSISLVILHTNIYSGCFFGLIKVKKNSFFKIDYWSWYSWFLFFKWYVYQNAFYCFDTKLFDSKPTLVLQE